MTKERAIARAVSLNNACMLTDAYAKALAATKALDGMSYENIKILLQSLKKSEYSENLKLLTGMEDDEIPF